MNKNPTTFEVEQDSIISKDDEDELRVTQKVQKNYVSNVSGNQLMKVS